MLPQICREIAVKGAQPKNFRGRHCPPELTGFRPGWSLLQDLESSRVPGLTASTGAKYELLLYPQDLLASTTDKFNLMAKLEQAQSRIKARWVKCRG